MATIKNNKNNNKKDIQTYTIVENVSVKRVYEIEAESPDEALDKMYSGDFEPSQEDEEGDSIFIYDEDGVNVSNEDYED